MDRQHVLWSRDTPTPPRDHNGKLFFSYIFNKYILF